MGYNSMVLGHPKSIGIPQSCYGTLVWCIHFSYASCLVKNTCVLFVLTVVSIQEAQVFNVVMKPVMIGIPIVFWYAMKPNYFIMIDRRGKIH